MKVHRGKEGENREKTLVKIQRFLSFDWRLDRILSGSKSMLFFELLAVALNIPSGHTQAQEFICLNGAPESLITMHCPPPSVRRLCFRPSHQEREKKKGQLTQDLFEEISTPSLSPSEMHCAHEECACFHDLATRFPAVFK